MPGGRPTVMTEITLQKLEAAFAAGCTDKEACVYADIAPSTMYKYAEENEAFSERKEALKSNPILQAKIIQLQALEDKCQNTAQKVLDREAGRKVTINTEGPLPVIPIQFVDADDGRSGTT